MRVLAIGDIVGKPGRLAAKTLVPKLRKELNVDLVVANGENAAGGFGLTPEVAAELWQAGIDIITSGNHIWNKREIYPLLDQESRLLRPANYPPGAPGQGWTIWRRGAQAAAVVNLAGRVFLEPLDCPFRLIRDLLPQLKKETPVVIVDFHGEATSEKVAFGWYVDGAASLVFGTHTHVQTADERILPGGTGYITDLGMTGPRDGVLGVDREIIIKRFFNQLPARFTVAKGDTELSGILADIDPASGRTMRIERVRESVVAE
ncbi:MAG: 2,3-cyclic-nucleotide 2-phosphodiesterase [Bacillota bacterium]|nr:2,3-cyclic-nucleotide 2-phosphodiesterase [Bacillota bacterium]MDK2927872.1 2,3-cyclic-nucleotide 2-phosphodiesterase [Bacillota bacterium]